MKTTLIFINFLSVLLRISAQKTLDETNETLNYDLNDVQDEEISELSKDIKIDYSNYKQYIIVIASDEQLEYIKEFEKDNPDVLLWLRTADAFRCATIIIPPGRDSDLDELYARSFDIELSIPDIQERIDKTDIVSDFAASLGVAGMTWDAYHKLKSINKWLDALEAAFPEIVKVVNAGFSYEQRPIKGIRISRKPFQKSIFIEGGIHGSEWVATAVTTYIAWQLLNDPSDEAYKIFRNYDWYLFPVINPDGYVYSHEIDRLWNNNRRPFGGQIGIDIFNNFGIDPNADNATKLRIPQPFSEPEALGLATFIDNISDTIGMYISLHSYGQMLVIPTGSLNYSEHYVTERTIGRLSMGELSVKYGTMFVVGNATELGRITYGASAEWMRRTYPKVPVVYSMYLRDSGYNGFFLPSDQLHASADETYNAILSIIGNAQAMEYLVPNKAELSHSRSLNVVVLGCSMMLVR